MVATLNNATDWFYKRNPTDGQSNYLGVALAVVTAFIAYSYCYTRATRSGGIYSIPGIPILTARTFFERRFDFLHSNFKYHDFFQFRVSRHNVVAVSGEEARKVFFGNPHLDFLEGYKILMGPAPFLDAITVEQRTAEKEAATNFNRVLASLMQNDRLSDVLPIFLADVNKRMGSWGKIGKIDPFVDMYNLIFQMTVRVGTCRTLSEDLAIVDKMGDLFMKMQTSTTSTALLLPWFPGRDRKIRKETTTELYTLLYSHVEMRRMAVPTSDTIDVLIARGLNTNDIVQTVLTIMYTGVLNTGIASCWMLIELGLNPGWKEKAYREALDLVNNHASPDTSNTPLHERIASIPLPAWEGYLPIIDLCIRETLRIYVNIAALRRNVDDNLHIGDKVIEKGAFVVYSFADVHLNDDIYSNPERFDPDRFSVRAEDVKSQKTHSYLAWGAGRHLCAGTRLAKLEMKLLVVLFLLSFEYKVVDDEGRFPNPLPHPDRNNIHQTRPAGKPCYLQYERVTA